MASKDLVHNAKLTNVINPAAIKSANATTTGVIIDTQGYESLTFAIEAGAITDGAFTPTMTEGDAANLSDGAAVAAGDMLGTLAASVQNNASQNTTKTIGYRGGKRYVRLDEVQTGATTGGFIAVTAIQAHARNQPSSTSAAPSP